MANYSKATDEYSAKVMPSTRLGERANERQVGGDHYARNQTFQHWDWVIGLYGHGYLIGCATKYIYRHRDKGGIADLQKALHYVQKLTETPSDIAITESRYIYTSEFLDANNVPAMESSAIISILAGEYGHARELIEGLIEKHYRGAEPAIDSGYAR